MDNDLRYVPLSCIEQGELEMQLNLRHYRPCPVRTCTLHTLGTLSSFI